jgi:hypothetical protein
MSQADVILRHLQDYGSITPAGALKLFNRSTLRRIRVMRLAARIKDLRYAGHRITTTMVHRDGVRWAVYSLEGQQELPWAV